MQDEKSVRDQAAMRCVSKVSGIKTPTDARQIRNPKREIQ